MKNEMPEAHNIHRRNTFLPSRPYWRIDSVLLKPGHTAHFKNADDAPTYIVM